MTLCAVIAGNYTEFRDYIQEQGPEHTTLMDEGNRVKIDRMIYIYVASTQVAQSYHFDVCLQLGEWVANPVAVESFRIIRGQISNNRIDQGANIL